VAVPIWDHSQSMAEAATRPKSSAIDANASLAMVEAVWPAIDVMQSQGEVTPQPAI
jgi:hypothetical protein